MCRVGVTPGPGLGTITVMQTATQNYIMLLFNNFIIHLIEFSDTSDFKWFPTQYLFFFLNIVENMLFHTYLNSS